LKDVKLVAAVFRGLVEEIGEQAAAFIVFLFCGRRFERGIESVND